LISNKDLKPEQQTEIEFGIDLAMLSNRLGLEFTMYNQEIEDLLVERTLAPSTGAGSRVENIANMTNNGIEIQLTGTPFRTKDFTWRTIVTYSSNENEVSGIEGEEIGVGNFNFAKAMNGQPLGVFKQGFYARNSDGGLLLDANGLPQRERGSVDANGKNVIERDANGQPTGALLQKVIGDPNPDFVASWTNEFEYGNFSLRAQFDAVQGNDVLSWDSRMFYRFGGGVQTGRELDGKDAKGTGAAKFGIAESYIEDGSFIKLRELSLSYLWNKPIIGLSSVRFTLSGRNLFSINDSAIPFALRRVTHGLVMPPLSGGSSLPPLASSFMLRYVLVTPNSREVMPGASITCRNTVVEKYWFIPIHNAYNPLFDSNITSSVGLFGLEKSVLHEVRTSIKMAEIAIIVCIVLYFISYFSS